MKNKYTNAKIISRILAFVLDYLLIIIYACVLYGVTLLLFFKFNFSLTDINPLQGQLIGFVTLTFPVFLYFFYSESGKKHATLGKRLLKIKVANENFHAPGVKDIFIRNAIKFTPWEIAHFGVHWIIYYSNNGVNPPFWVILTLIVPQLLILIYFASFIFNKDNRSTYDIISKTRVIR